jgi:hypothetical protein
MHIGQRLGVPVFVEQREPEERTRSSWVHSQQA